MKKYAYLLLIIGCLLAVCCNTNNEQEQNPPQIEKQVEEAKLLEALNNFNCTLSEQLGQPRQYDFDKKSFIDKPSSRSHYHNPSMTDLFFADAEGAYRGARKGEHLGNWGKVAGAVVFGAVSSAVGVLGEVDYPTTEMCEMIEEESFFDADSLYALGMRVETAYVGSAEELEGNDFDPLEINIGIGHNILLGALLAPSTGYNINNNGGTDTGGDTDGGEEDTATSFAEMYGDNISADILCDDVFEEDFTTFVTTRIQEERGEIQPDSEDTISDTVMNLFLEAALLCGTPGAQLSDVIDFYNEYVANSTALTESEKQNIRIGMIVAVYSMHYWYDDNSSSGDVEGDSGDSPDDPGSGSDIEGEEEEDIP